MAGRRVLTLPMPLFRQFLRHPVISLCNILGIALGVAVFLAMQTGNRSANRAFAATVDLVSGKANAELRADGSGFDEAVFPSARTLPGVAAATPMVDGFATLPDRPGEYLHILGVDLFTAPAFQTASFKPEAWREFNPEDFLGSPNGIVVPEGVARTLGLSTGQDLAIEANGRSATLVVRHIVPASAMDGSAAAESGQRLVLMDIAWAQQLLGMRGKLTSIQIMLKDPGTLPDFLAAAPAAMRIPPQATLAAPAQRSAQIQTMVQGFQLNLHALSMVSMLVGVFLIYNTVAASTVRRRKEIGILRALGATRARILRHFLAESMLYALPGVALGIWAGHALAATLVEDMGQTLSSRYLLVSVADPPWDPFSSLLAAAYGLVAAAVAAWRPAWEAATLDPVVALHPGSRLDQHTKGKRIWLALAAVMAASTTACALLALRAHPVFAFAACLCCVIGFTALAPALARLLARIARRVLSGHTRVFDLATESFERSLHRTGPTIAALLASVAMLIGVSTMVASFRTSVDEWIHGSMDADIYIAPAANDVLGMRVFMPADALAMLEKDPRLDAPQGYREEPVEIPGIGRSTLTAVDSARSARFQLLAVVPGGSAATLDATGMVFANESFTRKHKVAIGSILRIPSPAGLAEWTVAGIIRDYSDDRGRLFMNHRHFATLWDDPRVHSLGFRLRDGADATATAAGLRAQLAPIGTFSIYTRQSLRLRVLEIFDQTFAITNVLRLIAVIVAVIGVVLALLTLVIERSREISLLRALGASTRQVIGIHLILAAWVGFVAALAGGICGLTLAWLLVAVVNPAFFGWTIPMHPVWLELVALPVWLTLTAMAAGLYPAWRASRAVIAPALRTE